MRKHFKERAEIVLNNTDKFKSIALKSDFINDLSNFKYKGMCLVYFIDIENQLYIIDSEHKDWMGMVRDYKLKKILE